jgi:hypothetical protein
MLFGQNAQAQNAQVHERFTFLARNPLGIIEVDARFPRCAFLPRAKRGGGGSPRSGETEGA